MTKIKCRKSLLKSSHGEKCLSKIENHDFWGNIVVVVNGLTYFEEQWKGDDKTFDSRNNFEKISQDISINMKNVLPKTDVVRYQYVFLFFCCFFLVFWQTKPFTESPIELMSISKYPCILLYQSRTQLCLYLAKYIFVIYICSL